VHPERLRGTRSLITALEGMTEVAPWATAEPVPTAQTLLRWSLSAPIDRRVAAGIAQGSAPLLDGPTLVGLMPANCARVSDPRAALMRMAAESRARGWLRLRARWTPDAQRPGWARAALGQAPWS